MTNDTFDGVTFDPTLDAERLTTAMGRVYAIMSDGEWRTLEEIALLAKCSESGASARLRDMRKTRFAEKYPNGGVLKRRREGAEKRGIWEYKVSN